MPTRADDNGPFKEFSFGEWLCDSFKSFQEEMKHNQEYMHRASCGSHMRDAFKEQLLAMRDLVDAAIEQLDEKEAPQQSKQA